jgi:hypothetical protein
MGRENLARVWSQRRPITNRPQAASLHHSSGPSLKTPYYANELADTGHSSKLTGQCVTAGPMM